MKKVLTSAAILLCIIVFGVFIYPGIYEYDKLEQKYPVKINRITGKTEVLTFKGWNAVENISEDKMDSLRKELLTKLEADRQNLKNDIALQVESQIKNEVVLEIKDELNKVKMEVNQYKKFELDPNNYFSIGSTKDEVKKIMGTPSSIESYYGFIVWRYSDSSVKFVNDKVSDYSNGGKLRVK